MLRRAACPGVLAFVVSQPLLVRAWAPKITWPEAAVDMPAGRDKVVVFLLLDELNAKSAGPVLRAFEHHGLAARMRAVHPIGDATAKVVPAMFAGMPFDDAKPCGMTAICSGKNVLDFGKVLASRPDIDVVGFYHPYCAIQGLRYCATLSPSSPALDPGRWICAAVRRFAPVSARDWVARCSDMGSQVQSRLVADVEAAIAQAPVWRQGGVMFAHVPLPHPPGRTGGASLKTHYEDNVELAAQLVSSMVERARAGGASDINFIVFSDHPLRPAVWCGTATYRNNGCPLDESLVDVDVPLIVVGVAGIDISRLQTNRDVFRLGIEP